MALMVASLSLVMAACGSDKDDEPADGGEKDYLEVTLDGDTKRVEFPKGYGIYIAMDGFKDASGKDMTLFSLGGSVSLGRIGTLTMPIAVYTYKSDFNMTPGSYSFRPIRNAGEVLFDDWWLFFFDEEDIKKPFETAICLDSSGSEYYSSSGNLNVKSVKSCQISFHGIRADAYTIEATFTSKLVNKDNKNDKKDFTGKFSLTYAPEDD